MFAHESAVAVNLNGKLVVKLETSGTTAVWDRRLEGKVQLFKRRPSYTQSGSTNPVSAAATFLAQKFGSHFVSEFRNPKVSSSESNPSVLQNRGRKWWGQATTCGKYRSDTEKRVFPINRPPS